MAILASAVIARVRASIDADGSDYFDDTKDMLPALNSALEWVIYLISYAYGEKKINAEVFRELTLTRIYQTNQFSRIRLDDVISTINAIYPEVICSPNNNVIVPANKNESSLRDDLTFVRPKCDSADRLNVEQYADDIDNPFSKGNMIEQTIKTYGYVDFSNYSNALQYSEIELRPYRAFALTAIIYIKKHPKITATTDNILFTDKLFQLLADKTLQFVVRKQADNTTIDGVTERDVNQVMQLLRTN